MVDENAVHNIVATQPAKSTATCMVKPLSPHCHRYVATPVSAEQVASVAHGTVWRCIALIPVRFVHSYVYFDLYWLGKRTVTFARS